MRVYSVEFRPPLRAAERNCAAALVVALCLLARALPASEPDGYESGAAAMRGGDYATAWRILAPLAEEGDARAQNDVGVMYARGLGVEQSYSKSAYWITKSAEQGNRFAQSTLGYMYYRARGVERDYAAAALWSRRAAEQGDAPAQSNLGFLYDRGQGVEQDYAEAARWYRLAAEQGYPEGQRNLGSMYEHGNGVPRDLLRAYAWYGVASAGGDEMALELRARVEKALTPDELARARDLARDLHQRYPAPGQNAE